MYNQVFINNIQYLNLLMFNQLETKSSSLFIYLNFQMKYVSIIKIIMKPVSILRIAFTLVVCLVMVGVVMAAFILKGQLKIANLGFAYLGVYGVILLAFLVVQQIISLLNNRYWIPKVVSKSIHTPKVGLQVVGYREDPELFRGCLISLSKQDYTNVDRLVVGIDGNEEKDQLMEQAFSTVFPEGLIIRLDKMYQDMDQVQKENLKDIIGDAKVVCVSQPHAGKRQIMYTAMNLHTQQTAYICLSDSDTFFETNTLSELVKVMDGYDEMQKENPKMRTLGAVTGNVYIWNQQNLLSYLSYLRYWFAFNVERAADSYFGVVSCISGPLGLYRKTIIQQIKDEWLHQTFLGTKCTFGDDRHLTNLLLIKGYATHYTPRSTCKTDTPAELLRWIAQQTRWCKSFYREFLINIKAFHKQPLWLALQLVFQTIFPFFILATLIWFITVSLDIYCIICTMIILMGIIRGAIGVVRTRRLVFFYYTFYVFLYVLFLVPCKVFAFITLWDNQWGTSNRLGRTSPIMKAIHALVWAVFFVCFYVGIGIKHAILDGKVSQPATLYVFYAMLGFSVLLFIHWLIYSNCFLIPNCKKQFQVNKSETDGQILKRRAIVQDTGRFVSYKTVNTRGSSDENNSNRDTADQNDKKGSQHKISSYRELLDRRGQIL